MRDPVLRIFDNGKIRVLALGGLHYIRGNSKPYFTLTLESYTRKSNGRLIEDTFGIAHDVLVERWPELKPLADLHCADIDGMPMHALDNGWYWLQGSHEQFHKIGGYHGANGSNFRSTDECLAVFAKLYRLPIEEAKEIQTTVLMSYLNLTTKYARIWERAGKDQCKARLAQWVEHLTPRWKAQADDCIANLKLVVFGDSWNPQPAASAAN